MNNLSRLEIYHQYLHRSLTRIRPKKYSSCSYSFLLNVNANYICNNKSFVCRPFSFPHRCFHPLESSFIALPYYYLFILEIWQSFTGG